jgi:hypothetical protein
MSRELNHVGGKAEVSMRNWLLNIAPFPNWPSTNPFLGKASPPETCVYPQPIRDFLAYAIVDWGKLESLLKYQDIH